LLLLKSNFIMKQFKAILVAASFLFAVGGAFTTKASGNAFAGEVDYKPTGQPCQQSPDCNTNNQGISCTNTFVPGTNCQTLIASRLPL
jgi:hypothetical protein